MKKHFSWALAVILSIAFLVSACSSTGVSSNGKFTPGTYTAVAKGRGGPLVVQAKFSGDSVLDVKVVSHRETYKVGDVPLELYPKQIVENQSLKVDIVSGATISSIAFLDAMRDCVSQASGGKQTELSDKKIPNSSNYSDTSTDVVVIGGGAAGMTAAIRAAESGAKVILLEKLGFLGGTSSYSIEAFGATEDKVHAALGNPMSNDANYRSYVGANPGHNEQSFRILADQNGVQADWLRSIGAPLMVTSGGASVATSRESGKMGLVITSALMAEVKKLGIDTRLNNAAKELVMSGNAVTGVKVAYPNGEYKISAKAVVIASGGFGADNNMVKQYVPSLAGYAFSCSPGATGDGQKMAVAAGGKLGNMNHVRVNFTYHTDGIRVYYMGCLPNTGAIIVNNEGKRFINDQGGYGVGMKVVEQGGTCWAVFDQSMIDSIQDVREYGELGIYECADTISELCRKTGINEAGLKKTIEDYKGYVANGEDKEFHRGVLNLTFDEAPYYACKFTAHVQGTFGGIATNTDTQVLSENDNVIPGLYAAGECAYVGTNGANPMTVNIVYGTIAGRNAAAYAKAK